MKIVSGTSNGGYVTLDVPDDRDVLFCRIHGSAGSNKLYSQFSKNFFLFVFKKKQKYFFLSSHHSLRKMFDSLKKSLSDMIGAVVMVAGITIFKGFKIAYRSNQLESWQTFPPISMLGISPNHSALSL